MSYPEALGWTFVHGGPPLTLWWCKKIPSNIMPVKHTTILQGLLSGSYAIAHKTILPYYHTLFNRFTFPLFAFSWYYFWYHDIFSIHSITQCNGFSRIKLETGKTRIRHWMTLLKMDHWILYVCQWQIT